MKRIEEQFGILFSAEQSPYFQAEEEHRMVIQHQELKERAGLVQRTSTFLFAEDSRIDMTFLKSYMPHGFKKPRCFEKQALHRAFVIRNWKEEYIDRQESEAILHYATVKSVSSEEVFQYVKGILKGKQPSLIAFYNDRYMLEVNSDEVVIIAKNKEDINVLKKFLQKG
ncbi:hypothetical protein QWY15_11675 [Planococcus sp. N064]|uniref:Uncharacterized protein n=2 Tax=Planococcus liqunii TaxID=3058394 RepID=A0ABT8MSR6_9BACL|nr:hypothetical protein [Planococcus sp. N064]